MCTRPHSAVAAGAVGFSWGWVVARRRGLLAEINRQVKVAERNRLQQSRLAASAQVAAQREYARALKEAERARAAAAKATAADRATAQAEALRLYTEARMAEATGMNEDLAHAYAEIDSILSATLDVDDYVDLESLRTGTVKRPRFAAAPMRVAALC